MSDCTNVPTQTLFGSSANTVLQTETTTTTETSNLPDTTTTFVVTTSSCGLVGSTAGTGGITTATTCTPVTFTSTTVIHGGATTIVDTGQVVHTTESFVTFPTQTLFARSCQTTSTTHTSDDISTPASSAHPVTSPEPSTSNGNGTAHPLPSTYSLSTPPPTTFLANTSITSGGSIITSEVLVSSQPPPTTVFSVPTWKPSGKDSDASASMIGGVVGGVLGSLIVAGLALYFWRRRKRERESEEREYENQVRKEFGRRLEFEFEDDEPESGQDSRRGRLSAVDIFYSDDPPPHGSAGRPMSMAESTPMLISGAPNYRPRSSSSTLPNNANNRFSSMTTSLSSHHPLLTNDDPSNDVPPLPTPSNSQRNTLHDHSRRQSSAHSSAGSNTLQTRPQSSRASSDMLINLHYPPAESPAEHSTGPSANASPMTIPVPQSRRMSLPLAPAGGSSSPVPSSLDRVGVNDAVSRHQHNRSSSRSSIMSALLNVAPLQQLKIANRTKLDELDDEDGHEMSSRIPPAL